MVMGNVAELFISQTPGYSNMIYIYMYQTQYKS